MTQKLWACMRIFYSELQEGKWKYGEQFLCFKNIQNRHMKRCDIDLKEGLLEGRQNKIRNATTWKLDYQQLIMSSIVFWHVRFLLGYFWTKWDMQDSCAQQSSKSRQQPYKATKCGRCGRNRYIISSSPSWHITESKSKSRSIILAMVLKWWCSQKRTAMGNDASKN